MAKEDSNNWYGTQTDYDRPSYKAKVLQYLDPELLKF